MDWSLTGSLINRRFDLSDLGIQFCFLSILKTFTFSVKGNILPFLFGISKLPASVLFKFFFFLIGVYLINNVVIVSGRQQRDSAIPNITTLVALGSLLSKVRFT